MFQGWTFHGNAIEYLRIVRALVVIANMILLGGLARYWIYVTKYSVSGEKWGRRLLTAGLASYALAVMYGQFSQLSNRNPLLTPGAIAVLVGAILGILALTFLLQWREG